MKMLCNLRTRAVIIFAFILTIAFFISADAFYLPDTGQTKCYSTKGPLKVITCPSPGNSAAQDGSYTLNSISFTINDDGTVKDNNTSLMWQQQDDGLVRTWSDANTYCENLTLGGYADWRLPTEKELISIMDYGRYNPSIDLTVFPDTKSSIYWSSTINANNEEAAWTAFFNFGYDDNYYSKLYTNFVRCVRGSPLIFGDLVDNQNGTVTDNSTGLIWQKADTGPVNWSNALGYCENLLLGGYSDWRLPDIKELKSLSDDIKYNHAIDVIFFPSAHASYYWSSTTCTSGMDFAYATNFLDGIIDGNAKSNSNYGRCVRGGKTPLSAGEIVVNPREIGFGIVIIRDSSSQNLIVSNTGIGNMVISNIESPAAPFSILSNGCSGKTLSPGGSCPITLIFAPETEGKFTDKFTIISSDTENSTVIVSLVGSTSFLLPDTGQTKCYDYDGYLIDCPPPGNPLAQDGSYIINPPSYIVLGNGIVLDNNTGLMWQQQDDGQLYNWYKATGSYHKKYNSKTVNVCGSLSSGGHTDWRMPTLKELESIINYEKKYPARSIDSLVFPNAKSCYWSSDTFSGETTYAWYVNLDYYGLLRNMSKSLSYPTRCVRGDLRLNKFINSGNGTVIDLTTGLMWMQYASRTTQEAALNYCEGLTFAGYSDWRLPNIRELLTTVDLTKTYPATDTTIFPQYLSGYDHLFFWSSTSSTSSPLDKWYINLATGVDETSIDFNTILGCDMGINKCDFFAHCVRNVTSEPQPGNLTGTVTSSSTGMPISDVTVTFTDSSKTSATTTGSDGKYTIANITSGSFTATFEKSGYLTQTVSGTLSSGQTLTLDIQMTPMPPLTVAITSPVDGTEVSSSPVTVTGNVTNNAQVTVNGIQAVVSNNIFSVSISLNEGQNTITALANDQYGQTASQSIIIILRVPRPPGISDIVAGSITSNSITITWTTDQPSNSVVEYGETAEYGSAASDSTLTTTHSIRIDALKPDTTYHFKVSSRNSDDLSASLGDLTFTTLVPPFTVSTLGDYGNVTVMEVSGNYDAKNLDGMLNKYPRQEVAKEFLRTHQDSYDFFVVFSNFDFSMPDEVAKAFYLEVKNDTQGIGKFLFDDSAFFGSSSKLQGIIEIGNIANHTTNPADTNFEKTVATLAHEQMHRWGAYMKFRDAGGNISTALLGKDNAHWSFLLDSDGSVMYGNDWRDNGDGTFTSIGANKYYSPLDLYIMGIIDKTKVPQMLLIDNPSVDPTKLPEVGSTVSGTTRSVTIDDIIAAEGQRVPDASVSQRTFKIAYILLTRPNTYTGNELPGIENVRNAWAGRFVTLTNGKGSIADVTPSITITIGSPADGETINGNKVMVRGSIINSTGNETGVTVNGVVATVYGNQFMANVYLQEGSNTITATATDTGGNTASTLITVNTVTTGNYIRLTSNIESGIAPLETALRIDGSFSIENSSLSISGPVQPEVTFVNADEYTVRMTIEGTYFITASVTGPDGLTYLDTIAINVLNRTEMDNMLKKKWDGMNTALTNQDVEKASTYYSGETKQIYTDLFNALHAYLPQIAQEMQEIQLIYLKNNTAKYRMRQDELYGGRNITLTYYISFVIDKDGVWKIYRY